MTSHHCLKCGISLELRCMDSREREVCPACGWVYYLQLKVGAGVLIEKDGCILLLQRAHEPWKKYWNIPAGYVEADENPKNAAKREVFEETGLIVEIGELLKAYYYSDDPRGNGVALIYKAEIVGGELRIDHESSAVQYFHWKDIPANLAGGGHDQVILEWRVNSQREQSADSTNI
jgi:ADP-ribose pyrophosphatase YjhB (NUDIX family)